MVRAFAYLYILVIATFFFLPTQASALQMSSKRDCAVCHVMWIDDFRTDKETLIEWQPGNVLMKDTQGVVSSEDICYSCHDGYVDDSRYIVNKNKQHKTFVRPSKKVAVPSSLPLSNKDEIYCGTCHTAHGPGAPPAGNLPTPASFFRVRNVDSSLCEMCHKDQAAFKRTNGHPLKIAARELPDKVLKLGAKKATEKNKIICQSCHQVHGAEGDGLAIIDNTNSELCLACHDKQKSLIDTKHDLRLSLPTERNIKDQISSHSGPCSACHTPHNAAGKRLWARKLTPGIPASQMCLTCHGNDTRVQLKGVGKYSHPINVDTSTKGSIAPNLPLYLTDGTKNPLGKIQCLSCHDPHKWEPGNSSHKGSKNTEGDASNSFLRIANNASSKLCIECHSDKRWVVRTDHNMNVTAPEEKNLQGFTASRSGPCGACHIPHNAVNKKLWAKKLKPGTSSVSQMCLTCHSKDARLKSKRIGKFSHPTNVDLSTKTITTQNLPLFSADGTKDPAGKMHCSTCHDAHQWDPNSPSDNRGKNIEGDASNSFLRVANDSSSKLCVACHTDKKQVITSDHNLQITAPVEKNLKGFTASISGPCGACHIPHNASGGKLWAKSLFDDQDLSSQLCNPCHHKNGAAKGKLTGENDHPVNVSTDKLRSTATRVQVVQTLPLYGKNGGKSPNGNMVCLTCHDPHTWDSSKPEPNINYAFKNAEGDATNSFLRIANFPSSNLCKTCHINEAQVDGTVHDLNVSDPQATNLLDQPVNASGQCGACHLVHNSPHKLRLWARPYGHVSKNQSQMNALCTGCHSKGNLAEKIIPLIASHPAGKLITNVMRYNRQKLDYTPIYDENGQETNVGEISCPSCHNAHQWSPLVEGGGGDRNTSGDNGPHRYKFLRNMSYNTVCMDCHGLDGFFRYLYFHAPDKRIKR